MTATRTGIQLALILFSAPLLAADAPTAGSVTSLVYQCDDDKRITAVIDNSDLDHPKTTISVAGDPKLQKVEMQDVMSANVVIGGCQEMSAEQ